MTIHRVAIAAVVLLVGACGGPSSTADRGSDLLFMQTATGVTVIDSDADVPTVQSAHAVPAGDWSMVVRATYERPLTSLFGLDPATGNRMWERTLEGNLRPRVVSPEGRYVALVPAGTRYAQQTRRTSITVSGRDVKKPVVAELEGNFEPEAFSTDGKTLYVVQYLPANNPSRYQVRQLDIAKGIVRDVYSVDKELQQAMRGTARVQEMSPDGKRLYTLYTTRTKHGAHSFIHVLSLDEGWAHCIDLPHGLAMSGERRTALKLNSDATRLYVADTKEGRVAEVDVEGLKVLREAELGLSSGWPGATLGYDEEAGALYIGTGGRLVAASLEDLRETRSWELPERITGIQVGARSRHLYVGQKETVAIIDLATGERLDTWNPPGTGAIQRLGPTTPGLEGARTKFVCGC